jgi:hypothetical protein
MNKFKQILLCSMLALSAGSINIPCVNAVSLQGQVSFVAPGTPVATTLPQTLSSEFTRPGERFTMPLSSPIYSGSGMAVPAGAQVEAEVVSVTPAGRAGQSGSMDIKLRALIMPDGQKVPIAASIDNTRFELGAGKSRVGHFAKATAGGAAGGALSGLIGGAISGGRVGRGTALGTAIGGGLGVLGGAIKKGDEFVIPSGTTIPFRLDQTLRVASGMGAGPGQNPNSFSGGNQYTPGGAFQDPSQQNYSGGFQDPGSVYQEYNRNPYTGY